MIKTICATTLQSVGSSSWVFNPGHQVLDLSKYWVLGPWSSVPGLGFQVLSHGLDSGGSI